MDIKMTFRNRKIPRYCWALLISVAAVYFVVTVYELTQANRLEDKYKYKLNIMNQLIKSSDNQVQCQIPANLPVDSPEMMAFVHDSPPIECDTVEDWVACHLSLCSVKRAIIEDRGTITCDYSEIVRKNDDFDVQYQTSVRTSSPYRLRKSDFVLAKCWDEQWNGWSGIVYGLAERTVPSEQATLEAKQRPPKLNVLIYGFDSLSRNSFIRKLPKSYEYLTNQLKGNVLQGYNIVGDGTPQALIPLLTGFNELELPETRKRMKNSQYVDEAFPFVWKEYEREGYVTAFNEDIPNVGTFSYRLNGFKDTPTTHYLRTYYLAIDPEIRNYKRLCVGNLPRHQVMLNYTAQFMTAYRNQPHFVFSFHGELSHDSINLVGVADDDLAAWMKDLKTSGTLDNTLLIMMSDHGNRFAEVRNTLQGKLEERLPFFSFIFPDWFKLQHNKEYTNFVTNLQRLTTPFDVHATLMDILKLQSDTFEPQRLQKPRPLKRGISLFEEIPSSRSCADAFIEPHWCVCLNWRPINDTQDATVLQVARKVVQTINDYTDVSKDLCARLYLHEVKWAAKLAPHDNLLRFKQTNDGDGYLADLSSSRMSVTSEMYQVKIIVRPGDSIFEASVQHHTKENTFTVNLAAISRVNKYGNQASCIMELNPELRKYCYCKKTAPSR